MLHPALIQAAVKTPLRGEENHAFFEPDEFLANALAFAPANLPFGRN